VSTPRGGRGHAKSVSNVGEDEEDEAAKNRSARNNYDDEAEGPAREAQAYSALGSSALAALGGACVRLDDSSAEAIHITHHRC
jgi:hypothetical protein